MSMKILIDTCVLISASLHFKYKEHVIKEEREYEHANKLFTVLKGRVGLGYITKTVEDESKRALVSAVDKSFKKFLKGKPPPFSEKHAIMSLQETVFTFCNDKMEVLIEECTTRPKVDITERERIIKEEIEPFFVEILPKTEIYRQPPIIPRILRGIGFKRFLAKEVSKVGGRMIYPGRPKDDDMRLMAEATIMKRSVNDDEIYIASNDNHIVPNRIFVAVIEHTKKVPKKKDWTGSFDPRVRNALKDEFGFIGERPENILEILNNTK